MTQFRIKNALPTKVSRVGTGFPYYDSRLGHGIPNLVFELLYRYSLIKARGVVLEFHNLGHDMLY